MTIKSDREDLENILTGSNASLANNSPNGEFLDNEELEAKPIFEIDFKKIKSTTRKKAKKMIKTSTGLLLSDKVIASNPYLKQKMDIDIISLSGLLYQLEVNETMQKALMEEVQSGAASPRMFEVFSSQTKSISELNKQLLQTIEAIKMAYRDVKIDIEGREEVKAIDAGDNLIKSSDNSLITIGTSDLINQAKKLKVLLHKSKDIEDIEEI